MEDLERDGWLFENKENLTPKEIFDVYKEESMEFEDVVFDQFKSKYLAATANAVKRRKRSALEKKWFDDYRKKHPRRTHDYDGNLIFSAHPAQKLLNNDVKKKLDRKHSIARLWLSRKEYKAFEFSLFRRRVYQARRRVKFCNYLEDKRTEKRRKYMEEREKKQAEKRKKERKEKEREEQERRRIQNQLERERKRREKQQEKERKRLEREAKKAERERIQKEKEKEKERKRLERQAKRIEKQQIQKQKEEERERKRLEREATARAKELEKASKKRRSSLRSAATSNKKRKLG